MVPSSKMCHPHRTVLTDVISTSLRTVQNYRYSPAPPPSLPGSTPFVPHPPIPRPRRALLARHNGNSTGYQWVSFTRSPVCIIIPKLFDNRPINNFHRQKKPQIEEALHSINHQLRVLAESDNSAHRAKMSTLRSREVGITTELELIEVQIAEYVYSGPSENL